MKTPQPPTRQAWRSCGMLIAALGAAILLGCSDEASRTCAPEGVGIITGIARGVSGQLGGYVIHADGIANGSTIRAEGKSDSAGAYVLSVPPGRYLLNAEAVHRPGQPNWWGWFTRQGATGRLEDADTVQVTAGPDPARADFVFGAAKITVVLPDTMNGQELSLTLLDRRNGPTREVHANVEAGSALFDLPITYPGWVKAEIRPDPLTSLELPCSGGAGPDSFLIEGGATSEVHYTVPEPARIRGSIRGSWQALGYEAAGIVIFDADSVQVGGARTDRAGNFVCTLYSQAEVRIRYWAGTAGRWIGGDTFRTARPFLLEPGTEIALDPIVESGLRISVEYEDILRQDTADILLTDADGIPVQSDPDRSLVLGGHFGLTNLTPGTWYLRMRPWRFGAQDWLGQWYDAASEREGATPIVVSTAGEVVPLTIRLIRGGVIRGRILDGAGAPMVAAVVFTEAGSDSCVHPRSVAYGVYSILGLPDGSWKVGVTTNPEYQWFETPCWSMPSDVVWYPGTTDWNAAAPIEIRDHGTVEGIDLRPALE